MAHNGFGHVLTYLLQAGDLRNAGNVALEEKDDLIESCVVYHFIHPFPVCGNSFWDVHKTGPLCQQNLFGLFQGFYSHCFLLSKTLA